MHPLDVVVCMKPVPDPRQWKKLTLDPETMLLRRADIPAVMNPLDRHAIDEAVRLTAQRGGRVSVVSMAPPEAEEQLMEALAMGADAAYLLTDRAFAGADTLATARCLAAAIRKVGPFDLIFCGGYSLDGSTAQVGPQIAELLGLPDLTRVTAIEVADRTVRASCKAEGEPIALEVDLPALVTFATEAERPELPTMRGIRRTLDVSVVTWGAKDLGLKPETVGLRGSPTQMLNVFMASTGRKGEIMAGRPDEQVSRLIARLHLENGRPDDTES